MNVLKLIIPSWRFFDKAGYIAKLEYRTKSAQSDCSEWIVWPTKPILNIWSLFINARGNLYLAQQALIEQLLEDARSLQKNKTNNSLENTTSYKLILNALRAEIGKDSKDTFFQFKVSLKTFSLDKPVVDEVILSSDIGV